jgi:hypothetical protein
LRLDSSAQKEYIVEEGISGKLVHYNNVKRHGISADIGNLLSGRIIDYLDSIVVTLVRQLQAKKQNKPDTPDENDGIGISLAAQP